MNNQREKIVLFGTRSPLLPDYEETCQRLGVTIAAAVRVDDLRPRLLDRDIVVDLDVLGEEHADIGFLACAFSPRRREELVAMAHKAGLRESEALIDPTSVVASSTRFGAGCHVAAGVVIGAAGVLGDHVFINRSTNLGHHAFVDDFTSVGPGCTLAGNVHLGRASFVGAGSVILPGIRIGVGAVVAAGSVVREDVADDVLVAGAPATIKRQGLSPDIYGAPGEE